MTSPARIEICGGIASGKTTLAKELALRLTCDLVQEQFRDNPFWKRYYEQPDVFRPEKDVCFLAQHTGELKGTVAPLTICDYALIQDLAYAKLAQDDGHLELMRHLYCRLYEPLPKPTLIIHLQCRETELLTRIRARGRSEECTIDLDFLEALDRNLDEVLRSITAPVFAVRSDEINFATDARKAQELCVRILRRFSELAG
jgi:deoxyguanosine kinase